MVIYAPALRGLQGYVLMGALSPEQATEIIFPQAQVASSARGTRQPLRDQVLASARAGIVVGARGTADYVPGSADCASSGVSSNVQIGQVSGQLALTGVNIGAIASSSFAAALGGTVVLGAATLGIGAILGLLPLFLGHHAAAVRKERNILCTVIPATNNYFQVIDQAVKTGKVTPQAGIDALNSLVTDYQTQVAAIIHGTDPWNLTSGECNAACAELTKIRAIVAMKQSEYQDLIAAAPAAPASSGPSLAPPVSSGSTMQLPVAPTPAQIAPGPAPFAPSIRPARVPAQAAPSYLPIAALIIGALLLTRGF